MGAMNSESLLGEYVLIYIHHHFIITVKTARTNLVCSMSLSYHGMLIQFHQREEAEGSGGCDGGDQVRGAPVEVRPWQRPLRAQKVAGTPRPPLRRALPAPLVRQSGSIICFFLNFSICLALSYSSDLLTTTCSDVSGQGYGETKVFISI